VQASQVKPLRSYAPQNNFRPRRAFPALIREHRCYPALTSLAGCGRDIAHAAIATKHLLSDGIHMTQVDHSGMAKRDSPG